MPDTVQLSDFLDEAQRSGVTVVGEVGWKRPEQITTRLDQNDRLAGIGFYQARVPAVGVVAWHGAVQHLTLIDGSRGRNIWAYEDASALTDFGRFHWDLAHGPPPADLRADTS